MELEGEKKLHIVMFPWLAFGHIIPYLELSKLIAEKGHLVSFVSTPRNIDRLPKLPPHLSPFIKLVKLPIPEVQNLPNDAEATLDVPYNVVQFLKKAYDGLQQPLTEFLECSKPDWMFHDFSPYWIGSIASKIGIKTAFFSIFMATTMGFMGPASVLMGSDEKYSRKTLHDYTLPPPWVPFPTTVGFRYFEIMKIADSFSDNDSGVSDSYRMGTCIQNCDIVLVRSSFEFEAEWIQLLQKLYQKPVIPVGQLPTSTEYDDGGSQNDTWRWMKEWLDSQSKGTVVYVAFGSEAKPSEEEVREIALGLEKSELPFLWAFRAQRGPTDPEVLWLPDGFEDRTRGRGVVYTGWTPQMKVLSHDSVGGFLSHSGLSSVVEAIQNEKPLVFVALLADQGLISRVLEEKGLGYSIPRDERDGSFTSDSVADALRMVVLAERGRMYRENMREMKDLFVNKEAQGRYVNSLLSCLTDHKKSQDE